MLDSPASEAAGSCSSSQERPDDVDGSLRLPGVSDLQTSISLRSEEYRQLFRLPTDEVLVQDFNCALQESILLQGHMYLFEHYICFYSNIFGFETKKVIPFNEVTSVQRAKTAGIFPNAVEIVAGGRKHFFASFLSRDDAYKLIVDGWSQQTNGSREIMDQQELKPETSSQSNAVFAFESMKSSEGAELNGHDRNLEVPSIDSTLRPNVEDYSVRISTSEAQDIVRESELVMHEDSLTHLSTTNWEEGTMDAPGIPQCYAKVAASEFPIKVDEFFNLFFSDDAIDFVESFHKSCGDKEFRCSKWYLDDNFSYIRELLFQHPIKAYFGAKLGGCKELQKFRVYRNSHLVIESSQEVSDVPYADYFRVQGRWDVERDVNRSKDCCILRVFVNVAFSKKTIWKGKIEQSTIEECKEAYALWIKLAHQLLKEKKVAKSDAMTAHLVHNGQIYGSTEGTGDIVERNHDNSKHSIGISTSSEPQSSHQQMEGKCLDATIMISLFRTMKRKGSSFFSNSGNLQLVLVIMFTVILLMMQLSVVMLLIRPQQVYVHSLVDHSKTMNLRDSQADVVAWLEKRVHLLKDEMVLVEAQLERMRHEVVLLIAQLGDLERLEKQR